MTKRLLDKVLSAICLFLLAPVFGIVAWLVHRKFGSPVLFRQIRPGLHGGSFIMYKFRTMVDIKNANGNLLPDAERLTTFGEFLRVSSLDELPELWNVFIGDMSLVGPRPLLMEYLSLYTTEQARRQEVLPGITGWAQVNGRNGISWDEKFKLDVWYVDNRSLWLDIKIIWLTVAKVIKRDGINQVGSATMSRYNGHHPKEDDR